MYSSANFILPEDSPFEWQLKNGTWICRNLKTAELVAEIGRPPSSNYRSFRASFKIFGHRLEVSPMKFLAIVITGIVVSYSDLL
jgi:hypothetical protein